MPSRFDLFDQAGARTQILSSLLRSPPLTSLMQQKFSGEGRGAEERKTLKMKTHYPEPPRTFGSTDTNIGVIQRLAWPLCKFVKPSIFAFLCLMFTGGKTMFSCSNVHRWESKGSYLRNDFSN